MPDSSTSQINSLLVSARVALQDPCPLVVLHLDWPLKKSYDTGDDTSEGKNMALNSGSAGFYYLRGTGNTVTQGAAIADTAAVGELVGFDLRCGRVEWWRAAGWKNFASHIDASPPGATLPLPARPEPEQRRTQTHPRLCASQQRRPDQWGSRRPMRCRTRGRRVCGGSARKTPFHRESSGPPRRAKVVSTILILTLILS